MSRGAGQLQRQIAESAGAEPGISVGRLRWRLAEASGRVEPAGISRSFQVSFQRALRGAAGERHHLIEVESRKLVTLDELALHYPDKTHSAEVRAARSALLPAVVDLARASPPQFGVVKTERHALHERITLLRESAPTDLRRARRAWASVRSAIVAVIGRLSEQDAATLVRVLGKGSEYFEPKSPHQVNVPLRALLEDVTAAIRAEPSLAAVAAALSELCEVVLPRELVAGATLKDRLYSLVDFGNRKLQSMKTATKERLFEACPDAVAALRGHEAWETTAGDAQFIALVGRAQGEVKRFSPVLDQLLQRDALGRFEFVRPSDAS